MSKVNKGAFIYADESGNSGKDIFNKNSPIYYQGAIISVDEIESTVSPIVEQYCAENGLERLHGYELGEERVNSLCIELLDALNEIQWKFHYTILQKRYIAPTKFVDTIFDCYDNPAVHPLWYTTEIFRHTLCIVIDDMMKDGLDAEFWNYYLKDDSDGIIRICKILLKKAPYVFDKRVFEVISAGLNYAISNPNILTLTSAKGKSAYKKQTPNIIAFSSLLMAIHRFCKEYDVSVSEFTHDQSDEFKGTMREYHRMFFGVDLEEDKFGGIPQYKQVEYELGEFKIKSSKKSYGLQVADLFLWVVQRNIQDEKLKETKVRILANSDNFVTSRKMSLIIIKARHFQLMQQELTPEMIEAGEILNKKILDNQRSAMK